MDAGQVSSISPADLYGRLGNAAAPLIIDVRREPAFDADEHMIAGAIRRTPDNVAQWRSILPEGRPVVVYCVHGHEVSQGVASALRNQGVDARYLEGGIAAWNESKLPLRRKRGKESSTPSKWVTREHPKIDRIACPWLVSRFIDPLAEFHYVPPNDVARIAEEMGGSPYDITNVEFGHVGDRCSFDAIVSVYDIHEPALDHLATIVRGADTSRPDLTPQCEGLLAISYGLSSNFRDDHEMLKHGLVMYDALYTWCRMQAAPT
jgi:rhodanese-related sulfurtransferase